MKEKEAQPAAEVEELLPGLERVQGEWALICTGHNPASSSGQALLKLFRYGPARSGQLGNQVLAPLDRNAARLPTGEFLRRFSAFTFAPCPPDGCPS